MVERLNINTSTENLLKLVAQIYTISFSLNIELENNVRKMKMELKLPIFAVTDCDLYGLRILSVYSLGTKSMSYECAYLSIPDIFWLGVRPSDWKTYEITENYLTSITLEDTLIQKNQQHNYIKTNNITFLYL
ncbi:hypothetical protein CTI12_AA168680 [Artemisia annua]|uniref:Topoisomerase 6 subunit A/Spo11 TOPRIM domain-containing protein n=1 Tax=Artemisia annua TaxID=35608 RepID=A0A2U1PCE2_ARTAN|nr:hypothetical protein CTI12_AA168680 [Artemisia annua]